MSERVACAIDCDFGIWPKSVMIASAQRTAQLTTPGDLAFHVKEAVNDWLQNTPQGQAAYVESCQDFNAGDLLHHHRQVSLVALFAQHGVEHFELSAPVQLTAWCHDESLFRKEAS